MIDGLDLLMFFPFFIFFPESGSFAPKRRAAQSFNVISVITGSEALDEDRATRFGGSAYRRLPEVASFKTPDTQRLTFGMEQFSRRIS